MAEDIKAVEEQLMAYVGLQRRLGHEDYSFADALIGHRRQCIENLRESGDEIWVEQVKLLERLAVSKSVPLYDEPKLQWVIDELRERERRRRVERIRETRSA